MLATPEFVLARPIEGLVPVQDRRGALRVLIASLARGGAERIVLEWLEAEARRGRAVELAVVHPRRNAWKAPARIDLIEREDLPAAQFIEALARRWARGCGVVSTHLIEDELLAILWRHGVATIPTVHNTREGWRNDPARWEAAHVPRAIACADAVRVEMDAAGCAVPTVSIRHLPAAPHGSADLARRNGLRAEWRIGEGTLLVGVVGAFKAQKDFPRAVQALAALRRSRDAALVVLGGVLDPAQLAELDRTLACIAACGMANHVRLPGFVDPIGPWYAACDVILSVSRHEGLSMATREALGAGLPVVAVDVGGQAEIAHERLTLLPPDSSSARVAAHLAAHPVRRRVSVQPTPRAPRVWSVAHAWHAHASTRLDTLFVTANLNAGGAQRSLMNLACAIVARHRLAIAVCGETTHAAFADALAQAGVRSFRPASSADPFALAESILVEAHATNGRTICFWNADPRLKLLVAKFAPPTLRLVDVIPGAYAFEEMDRERAFAENITYGVDHYYRRLDVLVQKHRAPGREGCATSRVIANGVAHREVKSRRPREPRFLVSGRIAPSKRLETVVEAFKLAHATLGGELHIVGQAEPRYARYAAELVAAASKSAVRFRGPRPALDYLDEDFTAAVVFGVHQGCPNAILEAMAAGIPVIANASGGTGELVRERETGWLLPDDAGAEALAQALVDSASDPAKADAFALNARDRVRAHYSLDAMADRYLDFLERP
jgi:glycosyltransferase involved in cell wall biosynthesis